MSLYGFSYGSYTAIMSALETSSFAKKSAMTISLDRCVLYCMMVSDILFIDNWCFGVLLGELAGSSLLIYACPIGELYR